MPRTLRRSRAQEVDDALPLAAAPAVRVAAAVAVPVGPLAGVLPRCVEQPARALAAIPVSSARREAYGGRCRGLTGSFNSAVVAGLR